MTKVILGLLKLYKFFISPILVRLFGGSCRFTPTCSDYTIQAISKFGAERGLTLGIRRLAKCHPWGGYGYDPVKP